MLNENQFKTILNHTLYFTLPHTHTLFLLLLTRPGQHPVGIYLLKVNKRRSSVFIVNFEDISHLVLMFLLLTLNM